MRSSKEMKTKRRKEEFEKRAIALFGIYLMISLTVVSAYAMRTESYVSEDGMSEALIKFFDFLLPSVSAAEGCCIKTNSGEYCKEGVSQDTCALGYFGGKCSDVPGGVCNIGTCVQQNGDCDAQSFRGKCEDPLNGGLWYQQSLLEVSACNPTCCVFSKENQVVDAKWVFFKNKCEKNPLVKDDKLDVVSEDITYKACKDKIPAKTTGYCTLRERAECKFMTKEDCDAQKGEFSSMKCSSCISNYSLAEHNGNQGYGVYQFDSCNGPESMVDACGIEEIVEKVNGVPQCVLKRCQVNVSFTNLNYEMEYFKAGTIEVNGQLHKVPYSITLDQSQQACVNFEGPGEQHYKVACQLGELMTFGVDDSRQSVCKYENGIAKDFQNPYLECSKCGEGRWGGANPASKLSKTLEFLGADLITPKWWDYWILNPGLCSESQCNEIGSGSCVLTDNNDCVPKYAPANAEACTDCMNTEASSPWSKCGEKIQCESRGYCSYEQHKQNFAAGLTICLIETTTQTFLQSQVQKYGTKIIGLGDEKKGQETLDKLRGDASGKDAETKSLSQRIGELIGSRKADSSATDQNDLVTIAKAITLSPLILLQSLSFGTDYLVKEGGFSEGMTRNAIQRGLNYIYTFFGGNYAKEQFDQKQKDILKALSTDKTKPGALGTPQNALPAGYTELPCGTEKCFADTNGNFLILDGKQYRAVTDPDLAAKLGQIKVGTLPTIPTELPPQEVPSASGVDKTETAPKTPTTPSGADDLGTPTQTPKTETPTAPSAQTPTTPTTPSGADDLGTAPPAPAQTPKTEVPGATVAVPDDQTKSLSAQQVAGEDVTPTPESTVTPKTETPTAPSAQTPTTPTPTPTPATPTTPSGADDLGTAPPASATQTPQDSTGSLTKGQIEGENVIPSAPTVVTPAVSTPTPTPSTPTIPPTNGELGSKICTGTDCSGALPSETPSESTGTVKSPVITTTPPAPTPTPQDSTGSLTKEQVGLESLEPSAPATVTPATTPTPTPSGVDKESGTAPATVNPTNLNDDTSALAKGQIEGENVIPSAPKAEAPVPAEAAPAAGEELGKEICTGTDCGKVLPVSPPLGATTTSGGKTVTVSQLTPKIAVLDVDMGDGTKSKFEAKTGFWSNEVKEVRLTVTDSSGNVKVAGGWQMPQLAEVPSPQQMADLKELYIVNQMAKQYNTLISNDPAALAGQYKTLYSNYRGGNSDMVNSLTKIEEDSKYKTYNQIYTELRSTNNELLSPFPKPIYSFVTLDREVEKASQLMAQGRYTYGEFYSALKTYADRNKISLPNGIIDPQKAQDIISYSMNSRGKTPFQASSTIGYAILTGDAIQQPVPNAAPGNCKFVVAVLQLNKTKELNESELAALNTLNKFEYKARPSKVYENCRTGECSWVATVYLWDHAFSTNQEAYDAINKNNEAIMAEGVTCPNIDEGHMKDPRNPTQCIKGDPWLLIFSTTSGQSEIYIVNGTNGQILPPTKGFIEKYCQGAAPATVTPAAQSPATAEPTVLEVQGALGNDQKEMIQTTTFTDGTKAVKIYEIATNKMISNAIEKIEGNNIVTTTTYADGTTKITIASRSTGKPLMFRMESLNILVKNLAFGRNAVDIKITYEKNNAETIDARESFFWKKIDKITIKSTVPGAAENAEWDLRFNYDPEKKLDSYSEKQKEDLLKRGQEILYYTTPIGFTYTQFYNAIKEKENEPGMREFVQKLPSPEDYIKPIMQLIEGSKNAAEKATDINQK